MCKKTCLLFLIVHVFFLLGMSAWVRWQNFSFHLLAKMWLLLWLAQSSANSLTGNHPCLAQTLKTLSDCSEPTLFLKESLLLGPPIWWIGSKIKFAISPSLCKLLGLQKGYVSVVSKEHLVWKYVLSTQDLTDMLYDYVFVMSLSDCTLVFILRLKIDFMMLIRAESPLLPSPSVWGQQNSWPRR